MRRGCVPNLLRRFFPWNVCLSAPCCAKLADQRGLAHPAIADERDLGDGLGLRLGAPAPLPEILKQELEHPG